MPQPAAQSVAPAHVPGLGPGQQAYQLETGDIVAVETVQLEGASTPEHLVVRVRAWKVNADGTPAMDARGKPLEIPLKCCTIQHSALAESALDLENKLVELTADALARARTWLAIKPQIERLPRAE